MRRAGRRLVEHLFVVFVPISQPRLNEALDEYLRVDVLPAFRPPLSFFAHQRPEGRQRVEDFQGAVDMRG